MARILCAAIVACALASTFHVASASTFADDDALSLLQTQAAFVSSKSSDTDQGLVDRALALDGAVAGKGNGATPAPTPLDGAVAGKENGATPAPTPLDGAVAGKENGATPAPTPLDGAVAGKDNGATPAPTPAPTTTTTTTVAGGKCVKRCAKMNKKWKKKCKTAKCAGCVECASWVVQMSDVEEEALRKGRQAWREVADLDDDDEEDLDDDEDEDDLDDDDEDDDGLPDVPLSDKALRALHKEGWVCHSKCRKSKCKSGANGDPSTVNHNKDDNCQTLVNLKKCKKKACVGCPGCAAGPGPNVGFGSL